MAYCVTTFLKTIYKFHQPADFGRPVQMKPSGKAGQEGHRPRGIPGGPPPPGGTFSACFTLNIPGTKSGYGGGGGGVPAAGGGGGLMGKDTAACHGAADETGLGHPAPPPWPPAPPGAEIQVGDYRMHRLQCSAET